MGVRNFERRGGCDMACKVVWMARFAQELTRDAARRHWTEVHGEIGSHVPGMYRYQQNHVVGPLPGGQEPADGVFPVDGYSLGWWASRASYDDAMTTPEWAAMGEDAPNVFDRSFFWGMSALLDERVIRDGPEEGIKVVWIVAFRADVDPEEADRHWAEVHAPLALAAPHITRYVQNRAAESVGPVGAAPPALKFSGFSECWFPDASACREALDSPAWADLRQDGQAIFDYSRLWGLRLETREILTDAAVA
jgi:uncharacterized protein (TIGR02118 family)